MSDVLSICGASWSSDTAAEAEGYDNTGQEVSEIGDDTGQELSEIEDEGEWLVIDEVGSSDQELVQVSDHDIVEVSEHDFVIEVENDTKIQNKNDPKDGLEVTVQQDSWIRTVEAVRLTSDLRLSTHRVRKTVEVEEPAGPSGDQEDRTDVRIILPIDTNKLPRGLKSYERLPSDMLPSNMKFCPICDMPKKSHIKRHVLKTHLPWYWSATTACWECQEQATSRSSMTYHHSVPHIQHCSNTFDENNLHRWCQLINGAIFLLLKWFNLSTIDELYNFIKQRKIQAEGTFTDNELRCMKFYAKNYSTKPCERFTINPPNHIITIIHFEIITRLIKRCSTPDRLQQFANSNCRMTSLGREIVMADVPSTETTLNFIDAHFHLDKLISRMNTSTRSLNFNDIEKMIVPMFDERLLFAIANYVFPHQWAAWQEQTNLDPKIKTSFGIHPHFATFGTPNFRWRQLGSYLQTSQCVAIGETGLDFTSNCECKQQNRQCETPIECSERRNANQEEAFVVHLQLAARYRLPVILHCRDLGDGSAAARTLDLIRQHNFTNLDFHRHCFFGSVQELNTWNSTLPNVVYGIVAGFGKIEDTALANVVARIPSHKLLLETDSPYLPPEKCRINQPWNIIVTAEWVAKVRNVPCTFLMDLVNQNARRFYRL